MSEVLLQRLIRTAAVRASLTMLLSLRPFGDRAVRLGLAPRSTRPAQHSAPPSPSGWGNRMLVTDLALLLYGFGLGALPRVLAL